MSNPRRRRSGRAAAALHIKPEVHDVAFLHHVLLPLQAQLAGIARAGFASAGEVVREGDDFGADEDNARPFMER